MGVPSSGTNVGRNDERHYERGEYMGLGVGGRDKGKRVSGFSPVFSKYRISTLSKLLLDFGCLPTQPIVRKYIIPSRFVFERFFYQYKRKRRFRTISSGSGASHPGTLVD